GLAQLLGERDQVDGLAPPVQPLHAPEDLAVRFLVELLGAEGALELGVHLVVEHDAAEDALLGLEVVRRRAALHAPMLHRRARRLRGPSANVGRAPGEVRMADAWNPSRSGRYPCRSPT